MPRNWHSTRSTSRLERVALAPDWFFGRGCLTHLRAPIELLRLAHSPAADQCSCRTQPTSAGYTALAPGPAAGVLVATHFVYSMALKRKRAFRAFGWDLGDRRNRTTSDVSSCFSRSARGMLFGHTFFDQTDETKSILCSLPGTDDKPACSCCTGLGSMKQVARGEPRGYHLESTGGHILNSPNHFDALEGCNDYQLFWD